MNKISYIKQKKMKMDQLNLILDLEKNCLEAFKKSKNYNEIFIKIKTVLSHPEFELKKQYILSNPKIFQNLKTQ